MWATATFREGRARAQPLRRLKSPCPSSSAIHFYKVGFFFFNLFLIFIFILEINQMTLINKQNSWVLHHLNQNRGRPENISHYENFCLISKVTHFPDLINMKYILKWLYSGFLKFTMSLDCYASPLNSNIILVNEGLFRLTVQSHWDPSPLKETDLIFFCCWGWRGGQTGEEAWFLLCFAFLSRHLKWRQWVNLSYLNAEVGYAAWSNCNDSLATFIELSALLVLCW